MDAPANTAQLWPYTVSAIKQTLQTGKFDRTLLLQFHRAVAADTVAGALRDSLAGRLSAAALDKFRNTLLATLVTLLPRPGTLALAVGTGWLLNGVAMGSFGPTDLLFLGSRIFFLESLLWLTGVTRNPSWRDGPAMSRFLRLAAGFGLASLASSATGIALHMVLYRLFYADWYIAMMLLGPGLLYVIAACFVAVPFAASLRRVQR